MQKRVRVSANNSQTWEEPEARPPKGGAAPQKEHLPVTKIGASPVGRHWETRKYGECAAIVRVADEDGWPRSYACCAPRWKHSDNYCKHHHKAYFISPQLVGNKLARSLRKFT